MACAQQILDQLRDLKPTLSRKYKVNQIGLFGSVARGEEKAFSDIDLLVELDESADLLDLIGLGQYLEERLHRKVDVVPKASLRKEIRDRVFREVLYP
ncbi:nucleotidyltransferase family protein [Geoalkalibacter sp.]|uniref:nucleotidyltransferase family protein n=1 Tax=Geoalkalibacter sp. TaxID=3041440 RepID=UPI00272EBC73|nr:nucleotidyltransferase family protein [Geoalkalibacter sp.]